jgi:DNA-binding beta-propeller fold protein YncE
VHEASETDLDVTVPNDKNCTGYITITVNGKTVTSASVDGKPQDVRFNGPRGIVIDASGNLFVADNGNNCIRKIIME